MDDLQELCYNYLSNLGLDMHCRFAEIIGLIWSSYILDFPTGAGVFC